MTQIVENSIPQHKRILIIEDEMMMVFLLDDMLTALGYDIAGSATRYANASEQIEHTDFDIAILDVNLNGQKTFDLADQLQKKHLPFIFSTGYTHESLPENYQNCHSLQKPYSLSQLSSSLENALTN